MLILSADNISPQEGQTVTITITNGTGPYTATFNGDVLPLATQNGTNATITWPDIKTFGSKTASYDLAADLIITDTSNADTGTTQLTPTIITDPAHKVAVVTSLDNTYSLPEYAGYTLNDVVYAQRLSGDGNFDPGLGVYESGTSGSVYRLWNQDDLDNTWGTSGDLTINKLVLDSSPDVVFNNTQLSVQISTPVTSPTLGNTEVRLVDAVGVQATIDSITGSDPYTINFTFQESTAKLFNSEGYPLYIKVNTEDVITGNKPYLPMSTKWFVDLVNPVSVSGTIGVTYAGTQPTTGGQWVYDKVLTPDNNVTLTVDSEGYWTLNTSPVEQSTANFYAISSSEVVGVTDVITYGIVPSALLVQTLDDTTLTSSGAVLTGGSLTKILSDVSVSSVGGFSIIGNTSVTLEDTSLTATVPNLEVRGSLNEILENTTVAVSTTLITTGSLSSTLDNVTSVITSSSGNIVSISLDNTILSASGSVTTSGSVSQVLEDAVSFNSVVDIGSISVTLEGVSLSANGSLSITGNTNTTVGDSILTSTGSLSTVGSVSYTLANTTLDNTFTAETSGSLNITLDDVTLGTYGAEEVIAVTTFIAYVNSPFEKIQVIV